MSEQQRSLPTTADDLLGRRCAVLVWDMQQGIAPLSASYKDLLPVVQAVIAAAQAAKVPIVYSQHYSVPVSWEDDMHVRMWLRASGQPDVDNLVTPYALGSDGGRFVDGIQPAPEDLVVPKIRPDFFVGTPVAILLGARSVQTLVIVGVATERGVLATARGAVSHGFFPLVVSDAVGGFTADGHTTALETLAQIGDTCTSRQVFDRWRTPAG